jgi:hypothetical protein
MHCLYSVYAALHLAVPHYTQAEKLRRSVKACSVNSAGSKQLSLQLILSITDSAATTNTM